MGHAVSLPISGKPGENEAGLSSVGRLGDSQGFQRSLFQVNKEMTC